MLRRMAVARCSRTSVPSSWNPLDDFVIENSYNRKRLSKVISLTGKQKQNKNDSSLLIKPYGCKFPPTGRFDYPFATPSVD